MLEKSESKINREVNKGTRLRGVQDRSLHQWLSDKAIFKPKVSKFLPGLPGILFGDQPVYADDIGLAVNRNSFRGWLESTASKFFNKRGRTRIFSEEPQFQGVGVIGFLDGWIES